MAQIVRLVKIGGNLTVTIPARFARALGWAPRAYVSIEQTQGKQLTITELEDYLRERRAIRRHAAR